MIHLLKYWKLGALVGLGIIFLLMAWRLDNLGAKLDAKEAQIDRLVQERAAANESLKICYDNQKLAAEVSDEYETRIADLNRRHSAAVKRMRDNPKCIPVLRSPK